MEKSPKEAKLWFVGTQALGGGGVFCGHPCVGGVALASCDGGVGCDLHARDFRGVDFAEILQSGRGEPARETPPTATGSFFDTLFGAFVREV